TALLIAATGGEAERVHRALQEATLANLLERSDQSFQFVHDRVYEALFRLLGDEQKRLAHREIAKALGSIPAPDRTVTQAYALADHRREGDCPPRDLYEANLRAGKLARANFSSAQAVKFLEVALSAARQADLPAEAIDEIHEDMGRAYLAKTQARKAIP